jgi:phosphorylated CTD-interacting factor 1
MSKARQQHDAPPPSKKQRNKPVLAAKLHVLPISQPTGVGSVIAALPNRVLGQGKRKVWVGLDHCVANRRRTLVTTCTATTTTCHCPRNPLQPTLEALRAAWIFKLRKQFRTECGTKAPPALAFERWFQSIEMLYQDQIKDRKQQTLTWDGILQSTSSAPAAIILKEDLMRATIDEVDAERIVVRMYENTAAATQDMAAKAKEFTRKPPPHQVQIARHKHTLDLFLTKKHILKLNHEHYEKLSVLWKLTRQKEDDTEFHDDLYSLLARYYSIQGPGFQAACPEAVFDVLQSGLGVHHECFASPLNCFYGSYCSAFQDVDGPFGTSGSFWEFSPLGGGSFQANPPFVHHIMVRMVETMESLLRRDDMMPFSFVVIVPVWLEESSYQAMCNSKFKVHHYIIAKADHGFCDGAQHQRRDRYRVSPYDTAVFILQNKSGSSKFVPPPTFESDLRIAFATGVPTEAAIQRRKRDGRGETDEDGGGGVYKGRKRNRTGAGVEQRRGNERVTKRGKTKK